MKLHKHSQIQLLMWGSNSSSGLGLACDPEDPGSIPCDPEDPGSIPG